MKSIQMKNIRMKIIQTENSIELITAFKCLLINRNGKCTQPHKKHDYTI